MDDEDDKNAFYDAIPSSKGPSSPEPTSSPARTAAPVAFDDGGEPDFAGWLAAQSKSKAKDPLPKGLSKPVSIKTASTAGRQAAASRSATTKGVASIKPKPAAPAKKIDRKPKEESLEDDGWGDAWD
jgi:SCY1-like protein 1